MKTALVLFALVAASAAWKIPNVGKGELAKELQDFINLMPDGQITAIIRQYLSEDAEFQNMVKYLKSAEFRELVKDVEVLVEVKALMDYIQNVGVDIYYLVNKMNEFINLPSLTPPNTFSIGSQIKGGIRGFIDDIEAIIPEEEVKKLYEEKMKTSEVYRKFIEELSSDNFQQLVNKVHANSKFQTLLQHAEKAGVDLVRIHKLLKKILNIDVPSNFFYRNY